MTQSVRATEKSKEFTIDEVKEILEVKVLEPEENDNLFSTIIGNKSITNYFSQIVRLFNNKSGLSTLGENFHPCYFLLGEEGIGKTLTVFAFAKEMNLPILAIDTDKLLQDYSLKMFRGIKKLISEKGRCVVLLKEIQYISSLNDEKSIQVYSRVVNLKNSFPESFFFITSSAANIYPSFFLSEDGFGTILTYNAPDPKEREALILKFLKEYPYEEDSINLEKLARDFINFTGGQIGQLLKKSYIQAIIQGEDKLTYKIINETMYSELYGSKVRKMSEKEVRLTAYHEAGHVIAGYYACPEYKISKVEVAFRSFSLGLTDPEEDDDKLSVTKEDVRGQIYHALGGKCAEQIMFNTSTTGVNLDLMTATELAQRYIENFGMDPTFGPVYVDKDEFFSDKLRSISAIKLQEMLKEAEKFVTALLNEHKDKLIALAERLIEKETLYKDEILEILEAE